MTEKLFLAAALTCAFLLLANKAVYALPPQPNLPGGPALQGLPAQPNLPQQPVPTVVPSPTPLVTVTPVPSNAPTQNTSSSSGNSSSSASDPGVRGQVLALSDTGSSEQIISLIGLIGSYAGLHLLQKRGKNKR